MRQLFAVSVLIMLFLSGCNNKFNHRMVKEAQEYTRKHCPQRLDDFTVLDSMVYDVSARTHWRYFSAEPASVDVLLSQKEMLRSYLVDELKGDAKWKACKDEKINFGYVYRSAGEGEAFYKIVLTPDDYQ